MTAQRSKVRFSRISYAAAVAIVVMLAFACGVVGVMSVTYEMRMTAATLLAREPVISPVEVIGTLLVSILGLIILVRVVRRMALGQGIIPSWFEDKYSAVALFASRGAAIAHLLLAVFVAGVEALRVFHGGPGALVLLGMLMVFLYVTSVVGIEVMLAIASLAKGRLSRG